MENIFGWLLHILEMPIGIHQRIIQPTTKPIPPNRIYYGKQLKRITIFRHPYKKNVNGQIITDIYHKPINTQQYPHFKSYHPKNCTREHVEYTK